jgi:preprotein translocase subunit SecA
MFSKIVKILGGDPDKREVNRLSGVVEQINDLEEQFEKLSDAELRAKTDEFKRRIAEEVAGIKDEKELREREQKALNDVLPEAFAAVREASKRKLGMRHYDVQLIGGMVMHEGKISEMRTGEGKTLVATLPLYLNGLLGKGSHLVTVNDYLARRDARWMAPIYQALGLKVGVLQMAARTENGHNAFLVDIDKKSSHEDQDQLRVVTRHEAYLADITYGTNSEFGFDYLRDNLTMSLEERVQRDPHYYAIVDEVDNILIDEARTPLIISGPSNDESEWYVRMAQVVRQLTDEDYEINEKDRSVNLTEAGEAHVEEILELPLRDPDRPEDITHEQAQMMGYLEQALRAQFLYHRNKEYLVQANKVVIVDEFTGRLMPGRRWSDGLHQAVEAKEGVKVEAENVTYATITIQNYFRMYQKLGGMSGTAVTEGEEFWKIYKLDVLPIPTNLEYLASRQNSMYSMQEAKDEQGYKFTYYAKRNDAKKEPIFWKRKDFPDTVYRTEEAKLRAITLEVIRYFVIGRPQLVGTTSVDHSERLSNRLSADPVRRLLLVQLLRDRYLEMKKIELIERAIPELEPLNTPLENLEVGDIRQLSRKLEINLSFHPEDAANIDRLIAILNLPGEKRERLIKVMQAGIPHQVLNARKHDEESKIIARAGAFGAVTIATNMAGRGVDIKLGGDLDEEILGVVNRVLKQNSSDDALSPYDMTNDQRLDALRKLDAEAIGIYTETVNQFFQYMHEMEQVRLLGGLHVIGSERHEARRIDNQLRGRAARQGDPGSSRFYLSMDDELMRLFGGKQVEAVMSRLKIDESLPIESGLVGRLVEQSQERVEGTNFDVRKHLLEYDDVLNAQRKRIYGQRDMVFQKDDLSEDMSEMLRTDLQQRVPQALKDEEGPWKLLAYIEEIQPPIVFEDLRYPSFTMGLLINHLLEKRPAEGASASRLREELLNIARRALEAERDHLLTNFRQMLERTEESLESQRAERFDALDTFLETVPSREEEGTPLRIADLSEELSGLLHIYNFRLSNDQFRLLKEDPDKVRDQLREQIDNNLQQKVINRVVAAISRRLGEKSLEIRASQLQGLDWTEITNQLIHEIENTLERQYNRLLGDREDGQIARDLDGILNKVNTYTTDEGVLLEMLGIMMEGVQQVFHRRSHRRVAQHTTRLNYAFLASQLIQENSAQQVTEMVLDQLEGAQEVLQEAMGRDAWNRLVQREQPLEQLLTPRQQARLKESMGEFYEQAKDLSPRMLGKEECLAVQEVLGWYTQNEIVRQLLLSVVSDLWVDYLTKVEALRVSIGLEAYAQRDPLVQYKGRASEMFQQLLADIRIGVVSRLFTYRPRTMISEARQESSVDEAPIAAALQVVAPSDAGDSASNKKKRKRH